MRIKRPAAARSYSARRCHGNATLDSKRRLSALGIDETGQMAVELVVCLPVILAIALFVIHGLVYASAAARCDELAAAMVRVEATSPARGVDEGAVCSNIEADLRESFASYPGVSFNVMSEWVDGIDGTLVEEQGSAFSIAPHHVRYTVIMNYLPVGFPASLFGMHIDGAAHTRTYTIDPYKPGIWM